MDSAQFVCRLASVRTPDAESPRRVSGGRRSITRYPVYVGCCYGLKLQRPRGASAGYWDWRQGPGLVRSFVYRLDPTVFGLCWRAAAARA